MLGCFFPSTIGDTLAQERIHGQHIIYWKSNKDIKYIYDTNKGLIKATCIFIGITYFNTVVFYETRAFYSKIHLASSQYFLWYKINLYFYYWLTKNYWNRGFFYHIQGVKKVRQPLNIFPKTECGNRIYTLRSV